MQPWLRFLCIQNLVQLKSKRLNLKYLHQVGCWVPAGILRSRSRRRLPAYSPPPGPIMLNGLSLQARSVIGAVFILVSSQSAIVMVSRQTGCCGAFYAVSCPSMICCIVCSLCTSMSLVSGVASTLTCVGSAVAGAPRPFSVIEGPGRLEYLNSHCNYDCNTEIP